MQLIDSSALVRYFSKEEGWESVERYVLDSVTMTLAISELGNSLHKKVNKHQVQQKMANEIFVKYSQKAVLLHDEEYVNTAFQTAHDKNISFYDSLFIAACVDEDLELVTCDRNQAKVAREVGVGVIELDPSP